MYITPKEFFGSVQRYVVLNTPINLTVLKALKPFDCTLREFGNGSKMYLAHDATALVLTNVKLDSEQLVTLSIPIIKKEQI